MTETSTADKDEMTSSGSSRHKFAQHATAGVKNTFEKSLRILKPNKRSSWESESEHDDNEDEEDVSQPLTIGSDRKVIYVNVLVLDPSGVVEQQMQEKKNMPRPVRQAAQFVVKRMVTPEKVARIVSESLPQNIVTKTAERGIAVVANLVFQEGPYVVVELQVKSVDLVALIRTAEREEATSSQEEESNGSTLAAEQQKQALKSQPQAVSQAMGSLFLFVLEVIGVIFLGVIEMFSMMMGVDPQKWLEETYLPPVLQRRMEAFMDDMLAEELKDQGLVAISAVLSEHKQARFFFEKVCMVRASSNRKRGSSNESSSNNNESTELEITDDSCRRRMARRFRQVRASRVARRRVS